MSITVVCWLLLAMFTGFVAEKKNRNPFLWFLLGYFFGIFAFFAVLLMSEKPQYFEE